MVLIRGRALIRDRAECSKQNFNINLKRDNNQNCNSKEYTVNVQLTCETQTKTTVFVMWHYYSFFEQLKEDEPRLIHTRHYNI